MKESSKSSYFKHQNWTLFNWLIFCQGCVVVQWLAMTHRSKKAAGLNLCTCGPEQDYAHFYQNLTDHTHLTGLQNILSPS